MRQKPMEGFKMKQKDQKHTCPEMVECTVKDCRYHSEANRCRASEIIVSNEHAQNKTETFCYTFENRGDM